MGTGVSWFDMGGSGRAKRAMPTLAMMKPSRTWGTRIVRLLAADYWGPWYSWTGSAEWSQAE